MQQIKVTLSDGREIRTTIERSNPVGFPASSIAFAPDSSDIAAETDTSTYNGYCVHEIIEQEIVKMFPDEDSEALCNDITSEYGACDCGVSDYED